MAGFLSLYEKTFGAVPVSLKQGKNVKMFAAKLGKKLAGSDAYKGVSKYGKLPAVSVDGPKASAAQVEETLDALLGVPGLPQSATGQTSILTGRNAPQAIGRHYGPYPDRKLQEMLARHSIFESLLQAGQAVAYANAYSGRFLERLSRGKGRLSANTRAAYKAGLKLRSGEDLRRGRAISAGLSNDFWPESDFKLPPLSARQAGMQLANLGREHSLTFFEFWYPDLLGHKKNRPDSLKILNLLDDFLAGILAGLNLDHSLLLVVSDHGNFEDWTTNKHTKNPALTILAGAGFQTLIPELNSLTDLKAAIWSYIFSP